MWFLNTSLITTAQQTKQKRRVRGNRNVWSIWIDLFLVLFPVLTCDLSTDDRVVYTYLFLPSSRFSVLFMYSNARPWRLLPRQNMYIYTHTFSYTVDPGRRPMPSTFGNDEHLITNNSLKILIHKKWLKSWLILHRVKNCQLSVKIQLYRVCVRVQIMPVNIIV